MTPPRTPTVAVIMLHPLCNMTCSFCITDDCMGSFTLAQATALLDRLETEGFKSTVLGGGEPLAWKHGLFDLARQAKQRGFLVQVGTNGIRLPDGFEHIESVDRWVLPLDGGEASVHNSLRFWGDRHFQIITDRLETLRAARRSTTISTVCTRVNQSSVHRIAAMLHDLNAPRPFIHAWHLYQFIPQGRGGEQNRQRLELSIDEYDQLCRPIQSRDLGFTVFKRPDMLHSRTVEFFWMQRGQLHRQLGDELRMESLWDSNARLPRAFRFDRSTADWREMVD